MDEFAAQMLSCLAPPASASASACLRLQRSLHRGINSRVTARKISRKRGSKSGSCLCVNVAEINRQLGFPKSNTTSF